MEFNPELLEKRQKLIEQGVSPYPYSYQPTHTLAQLREQQEQLMEQPVHCCWAHYRYPPARQKSFFRRSRRLRQPDSALSKKTDAARRGVANDIA